MSPGKVDKRRQGTKNGVERKIETRALRGRFPDGIIEIDPQPPVDPMTLFSDKSTKYDKPGRKKSMDFNNNSTTFFYQLQGRQRSIKKLINKDR